MRFGSVFAALGLCAALTACNNDPSRGYMDTEDMLAASGFKFVPADTPARRAAFQKLTPHNFVWENKNGKVIYIYPDPTICVCIYVGGQKAYTAYQARRFKKNLAAEQADTAATLSYDWDWGAWGPMGWPYADPAFFY